MRHERDRRFRNRPDRLPKLRRRQKSEAATSRGTTGRWESARRQRVGSSPSCRSFLRSPWWVALLCVLVASLAYAFQLDVHLRLGEGEVSGWVAPYRQTSWRGRHRAVDPPIIVVHPVSSGEPRYFHTFTPGVFNRIKNAYSERLAAQRTGPFPGVPTLPVAGEEMRSMPWRKHALYGRIRYAGIGRKSVYAFEELRDSPVSD